MYDIESWGSTITAVLNFLGSLSWPIVVLIIICIFRFPILKLLANLKTVKWKDFVFEIGDKVPAYSPEDNKIYSIPLQQPIQPVEEKREAGVQRLSDDEIEQSKQRALKRLQDDTERVGYQRGKLFQLDDGKWAIAWEEKANVKIGIKAS